MKRINKREPVFFTNFIRKNNPVEWNDIAEIRDNIRTYMLSGLVPNENIEQNTIPEQILKFKWSNLFTSTNNEYFGAKYKDNTYRIKQEEYQHLINPSIENPNDFFKYSFTGEILIKEGDINSDKYKKAELTKDAFNLNERSLVEQRQTVVKMVKLYFDQQFSIDEIKTHVGKFDSLVENIFNSLTNMHE